MNDLSAFTSSSLSRTSCLYRRVKNDLEMRELSIPCPKDVCITVPAVDNCTHVVAENKGRKGKGGGRLLAYEVQETKINTKCPMSTI
jgi:hypothetical protein